MQLVWPKAAVQRCAVHKLRNMQRKAPKHAQDEIAVDFHEIVSAKCGRSSSLMEMLTAWLLSIRRLSGARAAA